MIVLVLLNCLIKFIDFIFFKEFGETSKGKKSTEFFFENVDILEKYCISIQTDGYDNINHLY